jgi:uncharacterized membrane protein
VIGFLAFVGVSSAAAHFFREPYNPGFLKHPNMTALHVIPGGIYLALAPLQFVAPFRNRWPSWHRWVGRALSAISIVIGLTAAFLAIVVPFSGNPERIVNGFFAAFFVFAIVKGVRHIRAKRVDLHREWMIRAFAIGLAIATMRLIMVPTIIIMGDITDEGAATLSIISFTLGFFIHWAVAEWWIRYTRHRVSKPETEPSVAPVAT